MNLSPPLPLHLSPLSLLTLTSLILVGAAARDAVSVSVTGLHGDVHQSVRVSVPWAKPYRVCQCECLSVCVLVSVSLRGKAGARPEWMGAERASLITHARTRRLFVCLFLLLPFIPKTVRSRAQSHTHNESVSTSAPHVNVSTLILMKLLLHCRVNAPSLQSTTM